MAYPSPAVRVSIQPPQWGESPGLVCGRWLGDSHCGEPATWHVIWTSDMDNGLCCDPHMAEAREHWVFYAAHSYNPTCSMPGAVFIHAKNVCVVDEDGLGLPQFDTAFMDLALKVVGR